jgi:hypothetical protein
MNDQDRHNRSVMLRRVRTVWLESVLEESLHGGEVIDLGFAYRPSALAGSDQPGWQQTEEYDYLLPVGTKIQEVFDAAGGILLVLGEPGAGKTTMLLQLVSHLMDSAEKEDSRPMPAVFSLATYADERPLSDWLVDELANNYEVPRKLSRQWVETGQFIPLLDGLDEVAPEHRPACAEAINDFRQQHPLVSMLVTARSRDYRALATRLHMDKAIVLQPLNPEQIDTYLAKRGRKLEGLRASLAADGTLRELAQTPLMLSIMTLAYYRMPENDNAGLGERLLSRDQLFEVYVERMARYRSNDFSYAPSNTVDWLAWLARQLNREGKPTFFLEDMQPNWLAAADQGRLGRDVRLAVFALLALPALVAGVAAWGVYGWTGLALSGLAGLGFATIPQITRRFLVRARLPFNRVETVESLAWSWPWAGLGFGLGLVAGLLLALPVALVDKSTAVPWFALIPITAGLLGMIESGLQRGDLRLRTKPAQGIDQSQRNGLMVGLTTAAVMAVSGLAIAAGAVLLGDSRALPESLPWILWSSLFLGLGTGLAYGGLAWLQHRRMRAILVDKEEIPPAYPDFLDFAAERNLMRKVGGGYTFAHALLLQYLSGRNPGYKT